jgi:hypothetical protein
MPLILLERGIHQRNGSPLIFQKKPSAGIGTILFRLVAEVSKGRSLHLSG